MLLMMLMLGSLPFVELSSVKKYAICSLIAGPFNWYKPLCHSGTLIVDLTVPIVTCHSQFHV